ncbi:MAG: MATE family efflux transporter [Elusimicrobiota bacterium]|jgi:MATE family multidrug resistance protein|nr:MATE family efflux transporter [Elusimicrobiota bacterium]
MVEFISRRYKVPGGYLEFLKISVPLIISTSIGAFQLFLNRTFLSWYSKESFAASFPAGVTQWAIMSLFIGTFAYVDVFVAQYYGKKEYHSIGPAVWQAVYLSFIASLFVLAISFFAKHFFMILGHPANVAINEGDFFRVLCYGAFGQISCAALAGFYAGRGKTKVILFVGSIGVLINTFLDYCFIFGKFGFPEEGIIGAAVANNITSFIMATLYVILILAPKNRENFNTACFKVDLNFMRRLCRFGFPNGAQFFCDMAGFGIFLLILGTLGIEELTANNIALNINHLIIMPLIGCGIATSVMVGKYLGENKASIARISVLLSYQVVLVYSGVIAVILATFPDLLILPFSSGAGADMIEKIRPITVHLLRLLAIYLLFDGTNIIFSAAIKGAGDTVFVMKVLVILSVLLVIIPTYLIVVVFKMGLLTAWSFMLSYVIGLAISFYLRYRTGKWKKMRVI